MGIPDHLSCLLKTFIQVKKQQLELYMEEQTGLKLGKGYVKAVCCHSAYLTSMQRTFCKILGSMSYKLESRLPGEIIDNLRYAGDITLKAESEEELKSLLMKVQEEIEKAGLKFNIQKPKIMASSSIAAAAKSLQSCPTLCDPIDCSAPGSSIPEILQARILERVAISQSHYLMANIWRNNRNSEILYFLGP